MAVFRQSKMQDWFSTATQSGQQVGPFSQMGTMDAPSRQYGVCPAKRDVQRLVVGRSYGICSALQVRWTGGAIGEEVGDADSPETHALAP